MSIQIKHKEEIRQFNYTLDNDDKTTSNLLKDFVQKEFGISKPYLHWNSINLEHVLFSVFIKEYQQDLKSIVYCEERTESDSTQIVDHNNIKEDNEMILVINKGSILKCHDVSKEGNDSKSLLIQTEEEMELNRKLLIIPQSSPRLNSLLKVLTVRNCNIAQPFALIPNIEKLSLINSIFKYVTDIPIKPIIIELHITGDEYIINRDLTYFSQPHFDNIKVLKIKMISVTNSQCNLSDFLSKYALFNKINKLSLTIKSSFNKKINIPTAIIPYITNLSLTIYNLLPEESFQFLLELTNLSKFKLICHHQQSLLSKEIIKRVIISNKGLSSINIGEEGNNLLPLIHQAKLSHLIHLEKIDMSFDQYDISKLKQITLSTFEYSKKKDSIVLYGEANLSFYNNNYLCFIQKVIKNYPSLKDIQLSNFDIENIDYLAQIISSFNTTTKLVIANLNINENFVKILNDKKMFHTSNLEINNITFLSSEAQKAFYEMISKYQGDILKLRNLDDINNYSTAIMLPRKIVLEEIYELDWELFILETFQPKNITFAKIDFDYDKLLVFFSKHTELNSITIKSNNNEDTNKLISLLSQLSLNKLQKLKIHINDEEFTDKKKEEFILKLSNMMPNVQIINMQYYRLSEETKEILYKRLPSLKSIK